jgi:hypothetical protein
MLLGLEKQGINTKLQSRNIKRYDNNNTDLKEIGFEDVNWTEIA